MRARHPTFPAPRLTTYGLWLIASRLGGPVLLASVVADLVRWWT
ncbi:MAG: hypothetical protein ACOCYE_09095 [Pseudomonadota bacterium]